MIVRIAQQHVAAYWTFSALSKIFFHTRLTECVPWLIVAFSSDDIASMAVESSLSRLCCLCAACGMHVDLPCESSDMNPMKSAASMLSMCAVGAS